MKNLLCLALLVITVSCSRNVKQPEQIMEPERVEITGITVETPEAETPTNERVFTVNKVLREADGNHDWITEFDWGIKDGRHLTDPSAWPTSDIEWMGPSVPYAVIHKFNIPEDCDLYQVRLRNAMFYFKYQTEEKEKLFPLEATFYDDISDLRFRNDFSSLSLYADEKIRSHQERVGEQTDPEHPLVGIWGSLPYLTEYRLIDSTDCLYYMEIYNRIPGYAVRYGTYLLKQTGEREFETISSFEDGLMRLEIKDETTIIVTPLFTLPDEKGWVAPMIMSCNPHNPRFIWEE